MHYIFGVADIIEQNRRESQKVCFILLINPAQRLAAAALELPYQHGIFEHQKLAFPSLGLTPTITQLNPPFGYEKMITSARISSRPPGYCHRCESVHEKKVEPISSASVFVRDIIVGLPVVFRCADGPDIFGSVAE